MILFVKLQIFISNWDMCAGCTPIYAP